MKDKRIKLPMTKNEWNTTSKPWYLTWENGYIMCSLCTPTKLCDHGKTYERLHGWYMNDQPLTKNGIINNETRI